MMCHEGTPPTDQTRRVSWAVRHALLLLVLMGLGRSNWTVHADEGQQRSATQGQRPELQFLQRYCVDCHSTAEPAGERDLEALDLSQEGLDTQLLLQDVIDQLTLGSMPPEDGEPLSTEERVAAIEQLSERLRELRQRSASTGGRTVLRRLSRREYRRTLESLLGLDTTMFDPTLEFPSDSLAGSFDNIGDALVTSGHLLDRYLEAADDCVEKALAVEQPSEVRQWEFHDNFYQQPEIATGHKEAFQNRFICLYDHPHNDKPEGAYGHVNEFRQGVPVDGTYEIRVLAKAMHRDTPYGPRAIRIDLEEPFRMGVRPGDTRIGDMVHTQPVQPLLAEAEVSGEDFEWLTFHVYLDRGFAPRFTFENGHHDFRGAIGRIYRLHQDVLPNSIRREKGIFRQRIALIKEGQLPHIRIDEVHIRGPIDNEWPTRSRQLLYGGAAFEASKFPRLLEDFASRAFRRPATAAEIERLTALYRQRQAEGQSPEAAFRDTLKAVLCSPGFLYFQQPDDRVASDFMVAERLAYFLTSRPPDEHLRHLAAAGQLSEPEVLKSEVVRLLAHSNSDAFVTDFLDSWLGLRSLGSMPPDPNTFGFYYAGDLEHDMRQETQLLFRDLLRRNAPLSELLAGKHSFINRDLAKLYDIADRIPPNEASEFQRVQFDDPRRGGLLGQASILTVSANGIETSPVVRGVWLLENILGTPPPPPPDEVPAIDPDTRGAQTIREQLTQHRADAGCYQCHRKIDPLGFALESFDAIGQLRESYDKQGKQPVDPSGELPDGKTFNDLAELKQHLHARQDFFARTVTEGLLTHALGRRMEPSDRAAVDAILAPLADRDYPAAELITAIVLSDLFRR